MSTPDRSNPDTHFVAPDADGDLTLWRGTREDPAPVAVQRECDTDPAVWAVVVGSLAAQPPATDRDTALELMALGRRAQNDPGQFVKRIYPDDYDDYERLDLWQARALDAAVDSWLAARPAPDTLADRVQAEAARWEAALDDGCPSCGPVGHIGCDHIEGYHHALSDLRALLAGRSDASPEGGEQRG